MRSRFRSLVLKAMAMSVLAVGCGRSSDAPAHSVSADQPPERLCEAQSRRVDLQGDPQGVTLWRAALYDNCMVSHLTDPDKAAERRELGQLEAFKGYLAMGGPSSAGTELAKSKLVAATDLDQILPFFVLLKASNKFSDTDLQKLDQAFPDLEISVAFNL